MTTIYRAKKIITLNASRPEARYVAVRDGRILGVGELDELAGWGAYRLNEDFADKILMPGFVEGHAHTMEGTLWRNVYCGYFDRTDPDGRVWPGVKSIADVLARLRSAEAELSPASTCKSSAPMPFQRTSATPSLRLPSTLRARPKVPR